MIHHELLVYAHHINILGETSIP